MKKITKKDAKLLKEINVRQKNNIKGQCIVCGKMIKGDPFVLISHKNTVVCSIKCADVYNDLICYSSRTVNVYK